MAAENGWCESAQRDVHRSQREKSKNTTMSPLIFYTLQIIIVTLLSCPLCTIPIDLINAVKNGPFTILEQYYNIIISTVHHDYSIEQLLANNILLWTVYCVLGFCWPEEILSLEAETACRHSRSPSVACSGDLSSGTSKPQIGCACKPKRSAVASSLTSREWINASALARTA